MVTMNLYEPYSETDSDEMAHGIRKVAAYFSKRLTIPIATGHALQAEG